MLTLAPSPSLSTLSTPPPPEAERLQSPGRQPTPRRSDGTGCRLPGLDPDCLPSRHKHTEDVAWGRFNASVAHFLLLSDSKLWLNSSALMSRSTVGNGRKSLLIVYLEVAEVAEAEAAGWGRQRDGGTEGGWPSSCCACPELGDLPSSSSLSAQPQRLPPGARSGPQDGSQAQSGLGACICKQEAAGLPRTPSQGFPAPS